jgi:hypothetical protein
MNKMLLVLVLIAVVTVGCVQEPAIVPEWDVETLSSECGTVVDGELDIRGVGNSIVITAPMQTSTPCYDAAADVAINGNDILVEINAESRGEVCIECVGKIVGRVTISNLAPGSYGLDVRTPDKAVLTTIMIE